MSSYDIALVLDADTLNQGMTQLYANSQAKQTLFQGTQTVGQDGVASIDWAIAAAPQFILTPPTTAQWTNPSTFSPAGPMPPQPTDQMFQVQLTSVTTTINLQQGGSQTLDFAMLVFAQLTIANNEIQLSNVAVLPSNASGAGLVFLEIAAGIVYQKVQTILQGYQIPSTITVEGLNFTPPVMTVTGGYLVVATNLTSSGAPDISGVQWPQQPLGVLLGQNFLSAVLTSFTSGIVQTLDNASVNYSGSDWTGSYSLTGGISNAAFSLGSALPNVNVSATFAATASVGVSWWLVPGACALEAASNLL